MCGGALRPPAALGGTRSRAGAGISTRVGAGPSRNARLADHDDHGRLVPTGAGDDGGTPACHTPASLALPGLHQWRYSVAEWILVDASLAPDHRWDRDY